MFLAEAMVLSLSLWLSVALPAYLCILTPSFPSPCRCNLESNNGNQDGDATRAGGAVIQDVSQHATVLAYQEEDLYFQVQTYSADISSKSYKYELNCGSFLILSWAKVPIQKCKNA